MSEGRVLVIGLDGWDHAYAQRLQASGELPTLSALSERSARFLLDPEDKQYQGLDWEHFLSGVDSEVTHRESVIEFDPVSYRAWQEGSHSSPFFAEFEARAVVFDVPYCDLEGTPRIRGVAGWAASDSGLQYARADPADLLDRIGGYPSVEWLDAVSWPSAESTVAMGEGLVRGLVSRRESACWLLTEGIQDWDLAVVVVSESHSAAEAFWHGVSSSHPLHQHASSVPAAAAMLDIYRETDRTIAELLDRTHAERVVVFALNGMGNNRFDVPSMILLPELLLRWSCGESLLRVPAAWAQSPTDIPILPADGPEWSEASVAWFGGSVPRPGRLRAALRRVGQKLAAVLTRSRADTRDAEHDARAPIPVGWHPAMHYQPSWQHMRAFALPSYSVGRIRVNVRGREHDGIVDPSDYTRVCDEVEELLRACLDPVTGTSVVEKIMRAPESDLRARDSSEADMTVIWCENVCAFEHPKYGLVGPVPFRRTGDHTGAHGFAYFAAPDIVPGDRGIGTVLDLAPTITSLVGASPLTGNPGKNLLDDDSSI